MKIQFSQDISNVSTWQDLRRFSSDSLNKIKSVLNGNVDLIDNGNNNLITFTFTKVATDVGVAHSLGTTPRGFINVGSSVAMNLINGKTANTSDTLYLQSNALGTVKVLVF